MSKRQTSNPIRGWLYNRLREPVVVELSDGQTIKGTLSAFDNFINIRLETPEGEILIRGSSIKRIYDDI